MMNLVGMKLAYLPKILSATIFFTFVRDVNFRSRYTLLKGAERLADWEKRFNRLFYYSELKKAWVFKESFRARYRETYRMRAEDNQWLC